MNTIEFRRALSDRISSSIALKTQLLSDEAVLGAVVATTTLLLGAFRNGKRVWFCGNGGSAADAQHLSAEFSGRFYFDRAPLPAEALHCNTSYLTAVANDYQFDEVYARLINAMGSEGDVLIGLSTSGKSKNIVKAFEAAQRRKIKTVGFTGEGGGFLDAVSDILVAVPSRDTPRIQECHMLLGHTICELVESEYFGGPPK